MKPDSLIISCFSFPTINGIISIYLCRFNIKRSLLISSYSQENLFIIIVWAFNLLFKFRDAFNSLCNLCKFILIFSMEKLKK